MSNKTVMSIRDFVIIYNLVEAEMRLIKSGCWSRIRNYGDAEIDAKVEEQLKNNMHYQELLSIMNRLDSMTIDVNVAEIGADIQLLIWSLYKRFFEKDPEVADMFKGMIKYAANDEDTFNPDLGKKSREREREDDLDMDAVIQLVKILSRINKEID